jgi:hypothetical protein
LFFILTFEGGFMCRRMFYSVSFVSMLILAGAASALVPAGWSNQDIGTYGGSVSVSGGTWTFRGDGADIWGNSDAFHYAYVPLSGDGEISARVVSNGFGSNTWAKGGVMIRETLDPDSKHAMMIVTGGEGGGKAFQCRSTTGGTSYTSHGGTQVSPPLWVKLQRRGNVFTGYYSYNGVNWIQQPSNYGGDGTANPRVILMETDVYIGLCVTSHAYGEVRTFTFDNVSADLPRIAINPNPADGVVLSDTWACLRWTKGYTADSHDVYFGDNFNDVEAGIRGTFQCNQSLTYFDVGLPDSPYPDGLAPGATYYWRIDEVEADGSIQKGNVWSFTVASRAAHNPYPPDGSKFVELDVTLSWAAGYGDVTHDVYFGDNIDDVNDGLGNTFRGNRNSTVFDPGTFYPQGLVPGKTYYWRIDEVEIDGGMISKGDVWSFTSTLPGLGTIVQERWNNIYSDSLEALKNHWKYPDQPDETTVLTRFETGSNLGENYGGRIHGWLYAPLTGDYTFWICSDDQGELWLSTDADPLDVELIAYVKDSPAASTGWADWNVWTKYASQKSDPVRLTTGNKYYIMAIWKEGIGGDHCQVAWEGPGISTRTIIPGSYLSAEPVGTYPQPADGARIGNKTPVLSWNPREAGVTYDVYLGTNFNLVNNANRWDQSGIYRRRWSIASYTTEELAVGRTYYWRIDEVEANGWTINKGIVWSFTIVNVETVEYQVSASEDDGYAANGDLLNLSNDYLRAGLSLSAGPPYYMSGMVFRNVHIPHGTEIISARLKICSHDNRLDAIVYGKVEAEAADNAEGIGGTRHIGSLARTSSSVEWDHYEPWAANMWYESPDIAGVIQEVINRAGWSPNNSLTILYSTRETEGGYRHYSSYDRGGDFAPRLEITYSPQ